MILSEESTPKVSKNGVHVKILCGESMGSKSSFNNIVPVYYLDFKLEPQASHTQEVTKIEKNLDSVLKLNFYLFSFQKNGTRLSIF